MAGHSKTLLRPWLHVVHLQPMQPPMNFVFDFKYKLNTMCKQWHLHETHSVWCSQSDLSYLHTSSPQSLREAQRGKRSTTQLQRILNSWRTVPNSPSLRSYLPDWVGIWPIVWAKKNTNRIFGTVYSTMWVISVKHSLFHPTASLLLHPDTMKVLSHLKVTVQYGMSVFQSPQSLSSEVTQASRPSVGG